MVDQLHPKQDKKFTFVDTCVIQFTGDKNVSKLQSVISCLDTLKANYTLAVSEITIYENLHGLWGKRATEASLRLSNYKQKEVSVEILQFASLLGGLYHDEKIEGVDIGDKIIASTAILEKGFILTANHKDFPHPFFVTEQSFALPYKVAHYTKTLDLVLYKPNLELIARRIKEKG